MNKKPYIISIAILIIFFIVMFLVFGLDNIKKDSYSTTIVLGKNSVFGLRKQNWYRLADYSEINWKKYDIYENNEKIGRYYLWFDDKWYAFDNNRDPIDIGIRFLGIRSNYKIDLVDFKTEDVDSSTYIDKVLNDNKLPSDSKFTSKYKVDLDFDKDGVEEEFYIISNAFINNENPEKIFSIAFMVKDDTIYPMYTDIRKNTSLNGCKPYFNAFLNVDDKDGYEVIISCSEYSNSKTTDMIYKYEKNSFKILISN